MDFIDYFKNKMASDGIIIQEKIIADGKLHRFHIEGDKHSSRNGWYVLYPDGLPSGVFGNWKSSISSKWCAKPSNKMTATEWNAQSKKMENLRYQRDEAQVQAQQQAAERACRIWNHAKPAHSQHPYFLKKHISPFIARQYKCALVLPVIDFDGRIWSLQFIGFDGSKKLLSRGAKKSRFIPIHNSSKPNQILICEGFATGATLAQLHPSAYVIAAIDAGNLEAVAIAARNRWPDLKMVICADDDRQNIENPGKTKGRHAAIAAGALLALPQWPNDAPNTLSDFNDLACWLKSREEVVI